MSGRCRGGSPSAGVDTPESSGNNASTALIRSKGYPLNQTDYRGAAAPALERLERELPAARRLRDAAKRRNCALLQERLRLIQATLR